MQLYNDNMGEVLRSTGGDTYSGSGSSANVVTPPGGSNGQLQFNNGNVFGGVATSYYDGNILTLGPASNVRITGGLPGEYLKTSNTGGLVWGNIDQTNGKPSIHWDVPVDGNNQQFVGGNLIAFLSNSYTTLYRNGVLVEPADYTLTNNILTVNVYMFAGDTLDIAAAAVGIGGNNNSGGTVAQVNTATSGSLAGFSLTGGPITDAGTITLNLPTAGALRTSLGIGTVANANFTGTNTVVLAGDGTWRAAAGGGTVNSVTGDGDALGFSLTGTVTTSGNITLTGPSVTGLRSTLGIGNVANFNLSGDSNTVLNGVGGWITPNAGTVTQVGGNGNALGFSLSGTVSNTGNITLAGPDEANLRTTLNIGNVANLNLTGNGALFLAANGVWAAVPPPPVLTAVVYGTEQVAIANPTGGTVNFDILANSIQLGLSPQVANTTLNLRGNGTTTANSLMTVGQSISTTYIIPTGNPAYGVTAFQIDGALQTVRWASNITLPTASSTMAYTFTVVKTAATPAYTVLGSITRYA
jgi:hypothetical protein